MARKGKVGIDYFSHDVDMLNDKKMKLVKAKHGLIGYAIYNRLLEELYREEGYYLLVDDDFNILFADDNNLDYNVYISILNDCIKHKLFDEKKYNDHKVLTSKRIQSNYSEATQRRKEVEFESKYLMIDPMQHYNTEKINVNILGLNDDINKQSKVKESKEKVKEKKIVHKEIQHLSFYVEDNEKLLSEGFAQSQIDDVLDGMENYSKLKNYKSALLTARNWLKKRQAENSNNIKVVDF